MSTLTRRQSVRIGAITALVLAGILVSLIPYSVLQSSEAEVHLGGNHHETSPAVRNPEVSGFRVMTREVVDPSTPAAGFRLTDRTGASVSLQDLAGKVAVLSFTYTNCPEACPLLTGNYLQLQQTFSQAIGQGDLALVFITTDPERDTAEHLQDYSASVGGKWLFLTGDLPTMRQVWDGYGVYREVLKQNEGIVVYHSYKTYLMDGAGQVRVKYTGVWSPQDMTSDIRELLGR